MSKLKLKALGVSASLNKKLYKHDKVDPTILEKFTLAFADCWSSIEIDCPEFTSLCPLTRQPDFGHITIRYTPDPKTLLCVESKSLKLYLGSFRNHGAFHEACIRMICNDLVKLISPKEIVVTGKFMPRGGLSINPTATWRK